MSKALIEKLRRAREFIVEAGGHKFTVRRPTEADVAGAEGLKALDYVHKYVVGWDLQELDLVPGGGPEAVPFSAELWSEWVDDQPEIWAPIANALLDAYKAHVAARDENAKN